MPAQAHVQAVRTLVPSPNENGWGTEPQERIRNACGRKYVSDHDEGYSEAGSAAWVLSQQTARQVGDRRETPLDTRLIERRRLIGWSSKRQASAFA